MIDTCYIRLSTGAVFAKGEIPYSLSLQLGVTFDQAVAFVDDQGNVVALPEGSTGRFILKPLDRFQSGPRFLMQAWAVQGEGAQRRYRFKAILDSRPLRNDFGNLTVKDYEAQIEYTTSGDVFASRPFGCVVSNNYFQGNDSPPPLPLGGPEAVEFHAEIFPPGTSISNGTHYAGNVNRGGDLFNVRLSVDSYHAGATVQILINGTTELFTEPVLIEAQTNVWSQDDEVNLLAVSVIPSGARIDVVTVFAGGVEYPVAPTALEVDMSIRTTAQIEQEGYDWLKLRLPESEGYTHNDEDQVIEPPPGGVTDHGALSGLGDDDHPQYHNDARGDARYDAIGAAAAAQAAAVQRANHTGTQSADTITDGTGNKAYTAAEKTKLGGIEAGADVTDAGNVGAAIHGAASKTTPVDADKIGLIDSAAANVLKYLTWANLKPAIKSYLEGFFAPLSHSHAGSDITSGTIDSARLDVGTTANKIVQLDGTGKLPAVDGSQLTGITSGGGAALIVADGDLQGHTSAGSAATQATQTINVSGWNNTGGTITILSSITPLTIVLTLANTDPADGSTWIDTTSILDANGLGSAINGALASFSPEVTSAFDSGSGVITITLGAAGSAETLSASDSGGMGLSIPAGTPGVDAVPPSGAVTSFELIEAVTGKIIRPLRVGVKSGLGVSVRLRDGTGNDLLPPQASTGDAWQEWAIGGSSLPKFFAGGDVGTALLFEITDTPGTGGTASVRVYAFQD